jgi:SAM-dependent methyltransferase
MSLGTQVNLSEIACNIEQQADGSWRTSSNSTVSYPEDGNDACFAVEDSSFWFRHRNACLLELLKSYPPSGTFFDVGGGNGFVAQAVQSAGLDVVLVEPGPAGVRNAPRRGIRRIIHGTLEDAQFRPATLPAVGLFDVIEHIQDDAGFLRKLHALLAPKGRVYITVPAFQALWSHEDQEAGHWRRYTLQNLSNTLNNCGYEVEFATYIFGFLPAAIFAFRVLPFRLGLRRRRADGERMRAEHAPSNRIAARVISFLTRRELSRLSRGDSSRFGASCMVAARKVQA